MTWGEFKAKVDSTVGVHNKIEVRFIDIDIKFGIEESIDISTIQVEVKGYNNELEIYVA